MLGKARRSAAEGEQAQALDSEEPPCDAIYWVVNFPRPLTNREYVYYR